MIILNGGGADWGLPEVSPFVTKTEIHLRMAGLAYDKLEASPDQSPKGQLPFIDDGGRLIGDSTFIRFHIEREYGVDLDAGLSPVERAQAFAIEAMCEHELTPVMGYYRWLIPENFEKGPAKWFRGASEQETTAIKTAVLDLVRQTYTAKGVARHTDEEIAGLGARALAAIDLWLGDKPFLMGDRPVSADALVFATLAGCMTPMFSSPLRDQAISMPRLVAYVSRMMDRFYPEFEWDAGLDRVQDRAA